MNAAFLALLLLGASPAGAWGEKKLSQAEKNALEASLGAKERADIREGYLKLIAKAERPAAVSVLGLDGKSESVPLPELAARLKDGDVVTLGAGVYPGLGGLHKRNVRVVGKGPYATFIHTQGAPLPVNGTEFWDLSLVDTPFITAGHDGVFAVGSHVVGDTGVEAVGGEGTLSIGLGVAIGDYSTAVFRASVPVYSVFSFHAPRPSNAGNWDQAFAPLDVGSYKYDQEISSPYSWGKGNAKGRWLGNPKFYAKVSADWDSLWNLVGSTKTYYPLEPHHRIAYKRLLAKVGEYMALQGHASPAYDLASYKILVAKGDVAQKDGLKLAALAFYQDANLLSRFAHNAELTRKAQDAAHSLRDGLFCDIRRASADAEDYVKALRTELYGRLPALALSPAGSCELLVKRGNTGSVLLGRAKDVVTHDAVYDETAASKERRAAESRARSDAADSAFRAATRARQARWDAAVESMQGTAAKLEAGRVRVEDVGGRKVMSYGSGDFRGGASAGTAAAYDAAMRQKAQAEAAASAPGSRVETELIGYSETTRRSATDRSNWQAVVIPVLNGEALPAIAGDKESYVTTRSCKETVSANGAFKKAECDSKSNWGTRMDQIKKLAVTSLTPKVGRFAEERILAPLKPFAAQTGKGALGVADSFLYRVGLGVPGKPLPNEDEAVRAAFGDRTPRELVTSALAF